MRAEAVARLEGGRTAAGIGGELLLRVGSALVLAAIAVGAAYAGGIVAGFVAAAVSAIVHLEWSRLTEGSILRWLPFTGAVVVAILVAGTGSVAVGFAIAAIGVVVGAALARDLWLPGGIAYAALLGLCLLALRLSADLGLTAIIFLFAVVWGTDTGAYFAGRLIGGAKVWPSVSPKKTWAGVGGGLVAALAAAVIVALGADISVSVGVVASALLLSLGCQAGDFFESAIKRRFDVKDSSSLVPGHGGFMDRVDGLVFASVIAALIGLAHGGTGGLARGLLLW